MDTPESHQPEQVVWSGKRSVWCYAGHWFFGFVVAGGLAVLVYFYRDQVAPWMPWAYGVPLLVMLAAVAAAALARNRWHYQVTNRRVIAEYGWIMKDTNEIRIQDIRSINVSRSGLIGFFGVGRVEFSSAATDDADVIFYQIGGANAVRDLVRNLQN